MCSLRRSAGAREAEKRLLHVRGLRPVSIAAVVSHGQERHSKDSA